VKLNPRSRNNDPEVAMTDKTVPWRGFSGDEGIALLVTLMAISFFSILGLFMMINASTGLQISDNCESRLQASSAALSGLNHARALLRGIPFDDVLKGPDGVCDRSLFNMAQARGYAFRNPLSLAIAQSLDVLDPSGSLAGIPDDGLINTGFYGGVNGLSLIPLSGVLQSAPNPYGPGTIATSRYFVKVSDNNGDITEIAGDPDNDPFFDGDGIILIRSIGVAKTQSDSTGLIHRNNSVSVFEARMERFFNFDLGPALVLQGLQINPSFEGSFEISGGEFPAIGTIDPDPKDDFYPDRTIRTAKFGDGIISGGKLDPSILDISDQIASSPMKSMLLNPNYLWNWTHSKAHNIADYFFEGDQRWSDLNAPYLGFFDTAKPSNAPGQDPKIVVVNGNLQLTGNISGGGLLITTGDFSCSGSFKYSGLILAIGSGRLFIAGQNLEITGAIFVSSLNNDNGVKKFGSTSFSIGDGTRIIADKKAVRMALELIPPSQIGFREIAGLDP
jgi:hypothetical protein